MPQTAPFAFGAAVRGVSSEQRPLTLVQHSHSSSSSITQGARAAAKHAPRAACTHARTYRNLAHAQHVLREVGAQLRRHVGGQVAQPLAHALQSTQGPRRSGSMASLPHTYIHGMPWNSLSR